MHTLIDELNESSNQVGSQTWWSKATEWKNMRRNNDCNNKSKWESKKRVKVNRERKRERQTME